MKKIISILICFLLIIFSTIIGFATNNTDIKKEIYNDIRFDYCYVTGLLEADADTIFEQVNSDYDIEITQYVENTYPQLDSNKLENTILYLQDNYDELVAKLSNDNKYKLDSYFLYLAIQYYEDNYESILSRKYDLSTNLDDSVISVTDSRIKTEIVDEAPNSTTSGYMTLRIFSDPTENIYSSSGLSIDLGTHSWIVVENHTGGNITVGKMSIANGTQISLGTWGNKSEHTGRWYNLEAYLAKYSGSYSNNISKSYTLSSSDLVTLNNYINSHNSWSKANNCSTFAAGAWNSVSSVKISAGVINTPKNLAKNIEETTVYSNNLSMRYFYKVHYANSAGTPTVSNVYTRTD